MAVRMACGMRDSWTPRFYRPQTGYYADVIEEAAALWEGLSQTHPFLDGNKRTAFAAMYTFLAINGAQLTANSGHTWPFLSALYEKNQFRFEQLVPWLREFVILRHEPRQ